MAQYDPSDAERVAIRLFRAWSTAREAGLAPIVALHGIAEPLNYPAETAPACASLFELVEGLLGRTLVSECCCSRACSPDELALIGLLRTAPDLGAVVATTTIPHGLPGAVCWAAMAVRQALGMTPRPLMPAGHCPFKIEPASRAA